MTPNPNNLLTRANHILTSWLDTLNIEWKNSEENSFILSNNTKINIYLSESKSDNNSIYINARELTSPNIDERLKSIQYILNATGKGSIDNLFRSSLPDKKRYNIKDNYEDIYLRLRRFIRSPNPKEDKLKEYLPIIKNSARNANRRYRLLASQVGFDEGDFLTIGLIHLTCFLHEYENKEDVKNISILRRYLNQRYSEWSKSTFRKHKNAYTDIVVSSKDHSDEVKNYLETEELIYKHSQDEEYTDEESVFIDTKTNEEHTLKIKKSGLISASIYMNGIKLLESDINKIRERINKGELKVKVQDLGPSGQKKHEYKWLRPLNESEKENIELEKKKLYDSLNDFVECTKCNQLVQKNKFGIRTMRHKDGTFKECRLQSYCNSCKSKYNKFYASSS
ncbi:MAG: hypothetical protein KGO96_07625 [Elusimicrobia bacterium]|nr:hypothetical protein [Elusimicrobiota bacterium]